MDAIIDAVVYLIFNVLPWGLVFYFVPKMFEVDLDKYKDCGTVHSRPKREFVNRIKSRFKK